MKTAHIALNLCGDSVTNGIEVKNGQIPFHPGSGMNRGNAPLLACTSASDGDLDIVHIAIVDDSVVLVPCEETPQKELVLVKQYSPGSGGKRLPSFYVSFGPEVRKLSEASTSGGSGSGHWVLVSAPIGWAQNIASQFVAEKDYPDQVIAYKPDFDPRKQFGDFREDLFIAFSGDAEKIRTFIEKVAALPADRLDDHIIVACGRGRRQAHLIEVSGDPAFFMGADPNRVAHYIAEIHFSSETPTDDDSSSADSESSGDTTMADAMRKAGLIK